MPNVSQLAKLFQSIAARDLLKSEHIASEIAAYEEKRGNHKAAQMLRGCLHPNGRRHDNHFEPFQGVYEKASLISSALSSLTTNVNLSDIFLKSQIRRELDILLKEWKHRGLLENKGIKRRSKLFFYGPPGCGKSLTARALGCEMSLPTFVVRFDAIIGAYLGQTAIHLRELFRFAETSPCVLVFDEIDALGKKRGNPLDVGELDRIVISLMQELEHSSLKGILVATSNMPQHIDEALWRRFDQVFEFPKPTTRQLQLFEKKLSQSYEIKVSQSVKQKILSAKSFAESERIIVDEARRITLEAI